MKIPELFGKGKTVFSFEVFPPKNTTPIESIYHTLDELKKLSPDFISVTYGARGTSADTMTCDIASYIQNELGITSAAHLTCVYSDRELILERLKQLKERSVENILALRGDINPDIPRLHDFEYASDLTRFIKENGDSSGNYLYEDVGRYPEVLKDRNPVTLSETSYNTTKYFEVQSGKCELWIDTTVKKRKW